MSDRSKRCEEVALALSEISEMVTDIRKDLEGVPWWRVPTRRRLRRRLRDAREVRQLIKAAHLNLLYGGREVP